MKKLTLCLAAISLIAGVIFLTACSEPISSETDDGLLTTRRIYAYAVCELEEGGYGPMPVGELGYIRFRLWDDHHNLIETIYSDDFGACFTAPSYLNNFSVGAWNYFYSGSVMDAIAPGHDTSVIVQCYPCPLPSL